MSFANWIRRKRTEAQARRAERQRADRMRKLQRHIDNNVMCGGMFVLAMSRNRYPSADALALAVQEHEQTCWKCRVRVSAQKELDAMLRND